MAEPNQLDRAHDIAAQIALAEIVRVLVGDLAFHADQAVFAKRIASIEQAVVTGLNSRTLFASADTETETYVKEAACGYVTRLLASVRHPDA